MLYASHIVGGVMFYDYLGNNQYRITVKVYRDCNSNGAAYDDPLPLGIFDGNNNLIQTVDIAFPGSTHLNVTFNNPCVSPPNDICTEEADYVAVVTLPANSSGYILSYERCCRGPNVVNLTNPGNTGLTLTAFVPPTNTISINSSPRFTNYPPLVLCKGEQLVFDHSATDPDGDSLVYVFTSPNQGADATNPAPNPPDNPPYFPVAWASGFTATTPLSVAANAQINAVTGLLTATPTQTGLYVVGIAVKEYRNGVLIGETVRDFLFRVVDCDIQLTATITPQTSLPNFISYCQGLTINFDNQSYNGTNYHWNFGDNTTLADTSDSYEPTYTYPGDGTYQVELIVNPGWPCTDSTFETFTVHNTLENNFLPPAAQCIIGNSFDFIGTGTYDSTQSTYHWNFGSHATPDTSNVQNPNHITFDTSGYIPVSYSVHWDICANTYTDSVFIYRVPSAAFTLDTGLMCAPYLAHFYDQSLSDAPIAYWWTFGDGGTSSLPNPTHIYQDSGLYTVSMTMMVSQGCTDTQTVIKVNAVDVKPSPIAAFSVDPAITDVFHTKINFTDESKENIEAWYYFSETDSSEIRNTHHTYIDGGYYYPYQIVTNKYGCKDTAVRQIYIIPYTTLYIPNSFTPNGDGINDVFIPVIKDELSYDFQIFDRWGNTIFHSTNDQEAWDGTFHGQKSPDGTYVYQLNYTPPQEKVNHVVRGHVTLLR